MNFSTESQARWAAWTVLFAGLAVRIALSGQFLLVPDEANYWQWSRHLALGYQDHPPMLAWAIRLATELFGQNELAVRLPANLGVTLAAGYTILLAARMFSWRTAFHVSLLFQGILLFNGTALIATPDSMLLFLPSLLLCIVFIYRDYPLLGRQLVATYYLVRAYNFKEGQRWQPRKPDDIRATKTRTGR